MMNNVGHSTSSITMKINIPDKGIYEKRFTFNLEDKVWAAKEQVIHEIGKESKDIQNYGFFVPPHQGKAGKFMDEGRPLSEYSIPGSDQILEFMLKRRIYRSISFDESKLTKIHNKTNLKKLIELVEQNNAGQVNQFLEKGLDPNFQDTKTGETPLTTAAVKSNANEVIMFLVNGGAYFDFKNRDGLTAVHRAAVAGISHNIKAFLDLGASPNYRDLKGLTPLYHACLSGKNPNVAELLLGDQAEIGVVDSQGWQEIHQVCRYGHVQHLEQLIYYGAEINAQNGSGNTPLHICSLYNQEDCARLLLYRGARRDIVNFANQTAEMVAVVATNATLSTFIRNYKESDVVPYIDKPTYSTRRRKQSNSRPTANSVFLRDSGDNFIFRSESLSTNSSTPSIHSETSEPMSLDLSPREIVPQVNVTQVDSPTRKIRRARTLSGSGSDSSYVTDSGDEGGSNLTTPVLSPTSDELTIRWRTYSLNSLNKEERGNIPRVKEVKGAANMGPTPKKSSSRKTYVAVTNFTPTQAGELSLAEGDLVEVITKGEKGYWQGSVAGKTGWFPADCVQDLKKRKNKSKNSLHKPPSMASSLNKSNTSLDQPYIPPVVTTPQPRQVILHKVKAGFGFQMRGVNAAGVNKLEFKPSEKIPALQYVGDVEPGGEAEKHGVKKGDYILEVNGNDVRTASHRIVVSLIRKTGQTLVMKLISIDDGEHFLKKRPAPSENQAQCIPSSAMPPPSMPTDKQRSVVVNGTSHIDGSADKKPPPIPSRAATTSLTSRPKSDRISVTDVDFEKSSSVQEDRVISIPRERIPSTDKQWHSALSGYSSLPRRPKSSYGAIIGSPHASPTEEAPHRNFRPVGSLDNTGFMTLPSKPGTRENAHRGVTQDDSVVTRRRPGSARSARDRPKSWMPKVLPSEPPVFAPSHRDNKPHPAVLHKQTEDSRPVSRTDSKKDKKRRFSFRKKKEKDYMATNAPESTESAEEPEPEVHATNIDIPENLHIEDEEARPNSLPGINKRLSTFKPVTVPHRQVVYSDAVSPELSQALQKRKSRGFSSGTDEMVSPVFSPGHEATTPVFPPAPEHSPPLPPRAKSLEESIKEEMMRRRSNMAPASGIPTKPRRTFEYRKSSGEPLPEGAEPPEEQGGLDSELAKAVARRAAKMTTDPKVDTHIYENVKNLNINVSKETKTSKEEPPALTIDEKLKKLHLHSEVILPTKFKPPVAPPSGKSSRAKASVEVAPPREKVVSPDNAPSDNVPPPEASFEKIPPRTFPKPKKKSPSTTSTTSDSGSDVVSPTSRPMTLPLVTSPQTTQLPPPLLSPEMVATQFLDDVIDEEVKRSNWDTASWKNSSGKSSPTSVDGTVSTNDGASPAFLRTESTPPSGKKKYVYKITMVTEKPADGSEEKKTVTQVITTEATQFVSPGSSELPPPPAPPLEFIDEGSLPDPVFTPPTSPTAPPEFSPPPPPLFSPPPPPFIEDDIPAAVVNADAEVPSSTQFSPPVAFQEDSPNSSEIKRLLTSEPSTQDQIPSGTKLPYPDPPIEPPPPIPMGTSIHAPSPVNAPSHQVDSEQTTYSSTLPPPVIPPPSENPVNHQAPLTADTVPPPEEFKEKKLGEITPGEIVVPPPTFADDTDSQSLEPKDSAPLEAQDGLDLETGRVDNPIETVDNKTDAVENNETVSNAAAIDSTSEESNLVENLRSKAVTIEPVPPGEGAVEVANIKEDKIQTSHETSQSRPETEASTTDEPSKIVSPADESTSQNIPDTEVQAPPDSKDDNENVVKAPSAYTENKEEPASPKTVEPDVSTDSSSFRETPYENWSCAHVCDWLASIGMVEHGDLFRENDIRGSNLLGLTKEDLRELGVKKLGHRMTIANEVNRLTTNNGAATNL